MRKNSKTSGDERKARDMENFTYGFAKTISGKNLDQVKKSLLEALASEGFGILTEIDVKATLKKKLDVDFRPYIILGACNPPLAHKSVQAEPQIGLLLPCNVVIQQTDDAVTVSALSPKAVFGLVDNEQVAPVAQEVEAKLRRVIESIN